MAAVALPACTTALLLDIEGTTTPITFVKVGLKKKKTQQAIILSSDDSVDSRSWRTHWRCSDSS